jgi:hypothetical protein
MAGPSAVAPRSFRRTNGTENHVLQEEGNDRGAYGTD